MEPPTLGTFACLTSSSTGRSDLFQFRPGQAADTRRTSANARSQGHPLALLAAVGLLASAVFSSEWRLGLVLGDSMSPALHSGQWFLLERGAYRHAAPRKGEVIVCHHHNVTYVKRIAGAAGDTVWLMEQPDAEGRWLSPVYPDLLSRARRLSRRNLGARLVGVRVPPHHVYVIGDMFSASMDSRRLGPIPINEIEGRVQPSFGLGRAAFADSAH